VNLEKKTKKRRKTKVEIKSQILEQLGFKPQSIRTIYLNLGYTGTPSSSFLKCINELQEEKRISNTAEEKQSKNNLIYLI